MDLTGLDTCSVSDALDRLGLPGAVPGLTALTAARRIAGTVITVELAPAGEPGNRPAGTRHLATAAIEAAGPGDVIVVAAGGRTGAAGWGGVLSVAAVTRGVAGVVVDGACRDVDEARDLGLPVYARSGVPRTARGRLTEVSWNEPVRLGDVTVTGGDWVVADGSGVVFVPAGRAREVIAAAREIAAREAVMVQRVRAGEPVSRVLAAGYENMLNPGRRPRC
jgi:4-hydroxy-4-methyl-2-oxoglutarate aldolase